MTTTTKLFKFNNVEKEMTIIETWQDVYLVADEVAEVLGVEFDRMLKAMNSSNDMDEEDVIWRRIYYKGQYQYITIISNMCLDIICSKIQKPQSKILYEFFNTICSSTRGMKEENIPEMKRCYIKMQARVWNMIDGKPFINCWCEAHNK